MITWDQWLNEAYEKLKKSTSSRKDAEILLKYVTQKSNTQLLAFGETQLKQKQIKRLAMLVNRRLNGEPIAYLIGFKEFWSLKLVVSPGVFIPRADTECLVEQVLNVIPNSNIKVLDLGTGIGNIALALASERPSWDIIGIDRKKQALELAKRNSFLLHKTCVRFIYGNWFKYLQKKQFHLIVSNPPYIDKFDFCQLESDIFFEPKSALVSKYLGLNDLIKICQHASTHLYSSGWLFLEHGWNQGKFVRKLLNLLKFTNVSTVSDYNQLERVTFGQWNFFILIFIISSV